MHPRVGLDTELAIATCHYNEDLRWLEHSHVPVVVCTNNQHYKHASSSVVFLDERCRAPQNYGREASAYLRFIVEYYDCLPKHIAFIHGHEDGWHQKFPGSLLDAIKRARYTEFPHVSLNLQFSSDTLLSSGNHYWDVVGKVWPRHFQSIVGVEVPKHIHRLDCGAQFIVARDRIWHYPKSVWELWLQLSQDPDVASTAGIDPRSFDLMAWVFEYTWHIIFGLSPEYTQTRDEYLASRFLP